MMLFSIILAEKVLEFVSYVNVKIFIRESWKKHVIEFDQNIKVNKSSEDEVNGIEMTWVKVSLIS